MREMGGETGLNSHSSAIYIIMSIHDDIWKNQMEAELNEHYYRLQAEKYTKYDVWSRWGAAVAASAVVVSLLAGSPDVQKAISLVTFGVSTWNALVGYGERARTRRELASRWSTIVGQLRLLDLEDLSDTACKKRLLEVVALMEALQKDDTELPNDNNLKKAHFVLEKRYPLGEQHG